jgi:hypothetical protein
LTEASASTNSSPAGEVSLSGTGVSASLAADRKRLPHPSAVSHAT